MRILIYFMISFLFCSCLLTEKQRRKICNDCPAMISIKDSIIERLKDTTIFISQQGPIQYLPNPCKELCDSLGNLKPFYKEEKKKGITSSIKTVGNVLVIDCKVDSLEAIIKGLREKESYSRQRNDVVKYIPCQNERTKFDGFTFWWFWISIVILSIYGSIKYFLKKFPFRL